MTFEEKNELGKNIRNLSKEDLKGVVKIMRETSTIDNQQKYFEFDLDKIHPRKLRELEKFVNNCILLLYQHLYILILLFLWNLYLYIL